MDSNAEKEVASALRYSSHANPHTVSTHEPEMLIKVVDGPEHHQTSMPRRRDHSGACQIEIDVLQHHNPLCDEALHQNIKDLPTEDVQGSYILLERVPVATCKDKNLAAPKSALKKPGTVPTPASKFSMHDEHALLRGSRKGTQLHDPEAFNAKPSPTRNTIENVMLLPKLGCSQPNFVARMEQKIPTKNRYDPTARPAASQKSTPTVVNAASTNQVKSPFDSSNYEKTKPSRPSTPQTNPSVYNADTNKSKSAFDPPNDSKPSRDQRGHKSQKELRIYSANTSKSLSPFDPCMDPSIKNKFNDSKSKTKVTSVYTTKTDDAKSPFDQKSSKLNKDHVDSSAFSKQSTKVIYHTCLDGPANAFDPNKRHPSRIMSAKDSKKKDSLVYKDVDGNVLPQGSTPYDTIDKKQSVYAVVSKSSKVSFSDEKKCENKTSITSQGNKSVDFSIRGVTYKTFKDPCFADKEGPVVMTATVRDPILPTGPTNTDLSPNEIATMTSFLGCCPPSCDVQVIGKPKENFLEESGSEDELNIDPSQQTVATDTVSRLDTASKNPYYPESSNQQPKDGCFKRVFLCGACRKNPETAPSGDTGAPSVDSYPASRNPTGYAPSSSGRPNSSSTRRPPSATSDRHAACSQSPSVVTGKSAKSHSKQGHNSAPSYRY